MGNLALLFLRDSQRSEHVRRIMELEMTLEHFEDVKNKQLYYFDGLSAKCITQYDSVKLGDSIRMNVFYSANAMSDSLQKELNGFAVLSLKNSKGQSVVSNDTIPMKDLFGYALYPAKEKGDLTIEGELFISHYNRQRRYPFIYGVYVK